MVGLMTERFGRRLTEEALQAGAGAWVDDQLSLRDRSLIALTALAVQGGAESRMRPHVRWALEHGATPEEIEAAMALTAVYAGYPRASAAMELVTEELAILGRPLAGTRGAAASRASRGRWRRLFSYQLGRRLRRRRAARGSNDEGEAP